MVLVLISDSQKLPYNKKLKRKFTYFFVSQYGQPQYNQAHCAGNLCVVVNEFEIGAVPYIACRVLFMISILVY